MSRAAAWVALVAAGAIYGWSRHDARALVDAAPWPTPLGSPIDAPAPAAEDQGPPPLAGAGTDDDPWVVPFSRLALPEYDPPGLRDDPTPLAAADLGEELASLDGAVVSILGYVLAAELDGERVASVVLSRYPPGCCFGAMPVLDEWIDVAVARDQDGFPRDGQVRVVGRLSVGEVVGDLAVESLYRLSDARGEESW